MNAPAPAAGIAVKAGDTLEVRWAIRQPRAERLRYAIACAGDEVAAEAGATFEEYRERRLAELRSKRDRDRAVVSSVASALVPGVAAGGRVDTPTGTGTVDASVDRQAVGDAVAAGVVRDQVELAPGDVGAGTLNGKVQLTATTDGGCTMTIFSQTPGVTGALAVTRVVDLRREREVAALARRDAALSARAKVSGTLVARGADPEARARAIAVLPRPEPEPEPEIPAPARTQAHADVTVSVDTTRAGALTARGYYIQYLVGTCHADPNAREKREQEAARRAQLAAELEARRVRIALDLRARLRLALIDRGADPDLQARLAVEARQRAEAADARARAAEQARRDAEARAAAQAAAIAAAADAAEQQARATRQAMTEYLVALGARLRPPMPPPVPEAPGEPPFAGAIWITGRWIWNVGAWTWETGGWQDRHRFDTDTTVDNHDTGWTTRDHRDDEDHGRSTSITLPPTPPTYSTGGTQVRDHRDHQDSSSSVTVRDHRKDRDNDKKDDDDKVKVRDHRK